MGAVYFVAQVLGGFMGFGVLKAVTPSHVFDRVGNSTGLCTTMPSDTVSPMQAVAVEFLLTMVLVLVCCGVWDPRNAKHHDSVPLRFGLAVACLALVGVSYNNFVPIAMNVRGYINFKIYFPGTLHGSFDEPCPFFGTRTMEWRLQEPLGVLGGTPFCWSHHLLRVQDCLQAGSSTRESEKGV